MNEQPYSTQVPEWFNNPIPENDSSRGPRLPKRVLRIVILIIVVILVIAAVPTVSYFSRPTCLTAHAYHDLTGTNYTESLRPTENFYTAPLTFLPATARLDESSASLMQNIANFYKKYESSSIRIAINNFYTDPANHAHALERAEILQSIVLREGVPQKILHIDQPTLSEPEDGSNSTPSLHSITITSVEGCR